MDDLERRLRDSGVRWRLSQAPPPQIVGPFDSLSRRHMRPKSPSVIMSLAAALALGGLGLAGIGLSQHHPGAQPSQQELSADVIGDGDHVSATGTLVVASDQSVRVCVLDFTRARFDDPPRCSPIAVELVGVDLARVPNLQSVAGTSFSYTVTVIGTWTGGRLVVDSISAPTPASANSVVPCPKPAGGWSFSNVSPSQVEAATARLANEIANKPSLYSGLWSVPITGSDASGGDTSPAVEVVGVAGDPDTVRPQLEGLFPYPLCVTRVPYSAQDLAATRASLALANTAWSVEAVVRLDRVRVRLTNVDAATASLLAKYPAAVAEPLVQKAP